MVSGLILPRIEFPCACHSHNKRLPRVQHAHCAGMFGGLIEADSDVRSKAARWPVNQAGNLVEALTFAGSLQPGLGAAQEELHARRERRRVVEGPGKQHDDAGDRVEFGGASSPARRIRSTIDPAP